MNCCRHASVVATIAMAPALRCLARRRPYAPAHTSREGSASQLVITGKRERRGPVERNVVPAPIPDGGICHAICREGHDCPNHRTRKNVVPVMELVDGEGAGNQCRTEDRRIHRRELPHSGVIVGEQFELPVEVQGEENKAGEGGSRVSAWHALERVVDFLRVAGADLPRVV